MFRISGSLQILQGGERLRAIPLDREHGIAYASRIATHVPGLKRCGSKFSGNYGRGPAEFRKLFADHSAEVSACNP